MDKPEPIASILSRVERRMLALLLDKTGESSPALADVGEAHVVGERDASEKAPFAEQAVPESPEHRSQGLSGCVNPDHADSTPLIEVGPKPVTPCAREEVPVPGDWREVGAGTGTVIMPSARTTQAAILSGERR